jgi:hypothetical protein
MLADAKDSIKRINWMTDNYEGCDWCCGGGDDEMQELCEELDAIKAHLHVTQKELETLCGEEIE